MLHFIGLLFSLFCIDLLFVVLLFAYLLAGWLAGWLACWLRLLACLLVGVLGKKLLFASSRSRWLVAFLFFLFFRWWVWLVGGRCLGEWLVCLLAGFKAGPIRVEVPKFSL